LRRPTEHLRIACNDLYAVSFEIEDSHDMRDRRGAPEAVLRHLYRLCLLEALPQRHNSFGGRTT
jgi:hypothetical protein